MPDAPGYDDEELLKAVREERRRSIGFGDGDGGELNKAREKALDYHKGVMADIPSLPNRSAVVDTAVADAIETVLPDIMEVFVGGEDVATFIPQGAEDEEKAQEESDFVAKVVFTDNEGFLTLYTAIKDALLTRTGIIHWWWEDDERDEPVAQLPAEHAPMAQAVLSMQGQETDAEEQDDGTVSLTKNVKRGKVCIRAFPSEDFTVAPDTVSLKSATYCAVRDRPRVQDLIARGIDAAKARELKPYRHINESVTQARDEANESQTNSDGASGDLRTVEVREHYIRLLGEDDCLCVWRVLTDAEETTLLDKEEVEQIPFAALTPYIVPHRFHGESVADKLIQVQQIKTVLLRNHMDSIYFALNQRMEVDMSRSNDFTISDLLRNEPGVPIRVKSAEAIRPVSAGALNVDTLASLEYAATMAEARSGIVRNAQGLNPDTLHDTARGALALISAAQKRVRMIARVFAETGIKELFLGVHALLRSGYTDEHQPAPFKRAGEWKDVKPQEWPEREAMAIHVGVGSAGREHDMMIAQQRLEAMSGLLAIPGMQGSVIDAENVYAQLMAYERATGNKGGERYWSDPAANGQQPQGPPPNPAMMEAQGKLQIKQGEVQGHLQLAHAKAAGDLQVQAAKHQADAQAAAVQSERDHQFRMTELAAKTEAQREQMMQEIAFKREVAFAELNLKRELGMAQAQSQHEVGMAKVDASVRQPELGGEPG